MTEFKDAIGNPSAFCESEILRINKVLKPGQEINVEEAERIGVKSVVFIGNNRLKYGDFILRPLDFQATEGLVYPGKSAMLDFLRLSQRGVISRPERDIITQRTFGKAKSGRLDYIFTASIKDINDAGFKVFFAPVKTNGLHIRLVYAQHTELIYPVLSEFPDAPNYNLQKLANIWTRMKRI